MADKKIAAKIALDGEKEFKSAVTSCNKALSTMKSEMNLVKAQTSGNANALESLKKKHEVLNKTLELSKQKEEAVANGLSNAKGNYEKIGSELTSYKTKLEAAKNKLEEMKASGTATDEELQAQEKTVESLTNTVSKTESAYQKAGDKVNDWQKQLNNAQAQVLTANSAVEENAKYMKEAESASDGCATSIDEFGKKLSTTDQELEEVNTKLGKIDFTAFAQAWETVGDTISSVGSKAYDAALELDEGYDTIITKTGATGDALDGLNDVANNIFGELPTTMADVGIAVGEVNTRFGLTDDALEGLSKQFIEFAEINGTDLNNAIDTVDKMIKQFGLDTDDATEVLGIMTKRGQETGISMDTLMSSISSNSATLKELGFSLEDSVNLLSQFEINGIDTSTALRSLKTSVNNAADGTLTAREALEKTIESIKNAESSTEALSIAQSTFGTKGAQTMADGIRDGRINLDTLSDSLSKYSTTVTDTYEATLDPWDKLTVATNNLKTAGADLAGEALGTLEPALSGLVDVAKGVSTAFTKMPTPVKTVVGVIGGLGVGVGTVIPKVANFKKALDTLGITDKITKGISGLSKATEAAGTAQEIATVATEASTAAKELNTVASGESTVAIGTETVAKGAEAIATETATVAQEGLNIAMDACPALLLVSLIGGVVGALAIFASNADDTADEMGALSEATNEAIDSMAESQKQLEETMNTASDSIVDAEASGDLADDIAGKLINLANKTSLTKDEQAEMATYVSQLNQLYPELGLEIDSTTGKLNKSNDEIEAQITNLKNLSLATAYQELYSDIISETTDNQKELIKASGQLEDVNEKLQKTQEDYNKVIEMSNESVANGNEGLIEWNGTVQSSDQVLQQLKSQEEDLTNQQTNLNDKIEENQSVVDAAKEEAQGYYETYMNLNSATQDNTDATNANTEAQNAAADAHQYSINTAGEAAAAFNSLSETDQQAAVNVANSITTLTDSVESALSSQMNMFDEFNAGSETTKEQILANMQSQVDGVTAWESNMNTLMTQTKETTDGTQVAIDEGLMQYLASMGPEGATYVQEFVNMSGDELKQANDLWAQSVDIKSMTNNLGQQLQDGVGSLAAGSADAFQQLASDLGVQASDAGGYVGQGLVDGLNDAKSEIESAGEESGNTVIEGLNTGSGVASPSWKTRLTGNYLVQGLQEGIRNHQYRATGQVNTLASLTISTFSNNFTAARTQQYGYYLVSGLANGILNNQSVAINAATTMAANTIAAAKSKLEINSPSHVFQRLGSGVIEGFVKGIDDNASDATETIKDAMDFSNVSVNASWNANSLTGSISNAIASSGANSELIRKIDEVYTILQTYLPDAGNVYLDGAAVSKKITSYQNKDAKIKSKISGVM